MNYDAIDFGHSGPALATALLFANVAMAADATPEGGLPMKELTCRLMAADGVNGNPPLDWEVLLKQDPPDFMEAVMDITASLDDKGQLPDHIRSMDCFRRVQ